MATWTDNKIRAFRPTATRQENSIGNGLYLVVQPSGAKSWALRYRQGGKPVKLTLGTFFAGDKDAPEPKIGGPLTLNGARGLASAARIEIAKGGDPVAAKREAKQAKQQADANTFEAVALDYLEDKCGMKLDDKGKPTFSGEKRSAKWEHATLLRLVFPEIGKRPIAQVKRLEVKHLLKKIKNERGPVMADRTLAIIRTVMNWFALCDEDFRSPIVRGMEHTKQSERARERVLSDNELRAVWKVSGEMNDPFAALVRFLLLTAARRTEAAAMEWSEVKDGVWTLPASRNKTGKELARPLSEVAMLVLPPKIEGCPYVFTYDGRRPLAGYGGLKERFDKRVEAAMLGEAIPNWRLHDLRRTARSLMGRADVPSDHAERCLGHVIPGVRGVYDRHKYEAAMERAYELLARQIESIVNPPADNVVAFSKTGEGE
jgi:integrase